MASTMQVILARDVPNLGRIGELVKVRAGYGRNYLVPQSMAFVASPEKVREFEHKKKLIEHRLRIVRSESEAQAKKIAEVEINLTARVGKQGKLFGSITAKDIGAAMKEQGYVIDHRDLKMDGPLRTVGMHKLDLRLEAGVKTSVKVMITAEKVEEDELEAAGEDGEMALDATGEPDLEAEEEKIEQAEASAE